MNKAVTIGGVNRHVMTQDNNILSAYGHAQLERYTLNESENTGVDTKVHVHRSATKFKLVTGLNVDQCMFVLLHV